ncbi:MAG: PQQ-binding-like beta-propeller repeat protein [Microscillaceae bacterium]|nr:PQQ-binding-like beta-propeller repeat protein [Microscillaceae bacterium]
MSQSPEKIGKGCAALINLVVSVLILVVLAFVLLPGFVKLPDWAEKLRKSNLIDRRKAQGPVHLIPNSQNARQADLLVLNRLDGAISLRNVLKTDAPPQVRPLWFSYLQTEPYERRWEKPLPQSDGLAREQLALTTTYSQLFFSVKNQLYAWKLRTGEKEWQAPLRDVLNPLCRQCLQVSLDFKTVLVLGQDQYLQAFHTQTGKAKWQVRVQQIRSEGESFYVYQNRVGLKDLVQGKAFYREFDIQTGRVLQEWPLENYLPNSPHLRQRTQLAYFAQKVGANASFQLRLLNILKENKLRLQWEIALPAGCEIPLLPSVRALHPEEWWHQEGDFYYLLLSNVRGGQVLYRINLQNGQLQEWLKEEDYELSIVDTNRDFLLLNARRRRGSSRNELWMMAKNTGKIRWKYLLNSESPYQTKALQIDWAAWLDEQSLVLLEQDANQKIRVQLFRAFDGELLKKSQYKLSGGPWTGLNRLENFAWLSLGDVYGLDLKNPQLIKVFP